MSDSNNHNNKNLLVQFIVEYVVRKGYSLNRWNELSDKRKKEIKNNDSEKAVWKVVHGHTDSRGKRGESIYKKDKYTSLKKANARHTAIRLNK